jgi:cellobiose phosphorylase
LDGGWRVYSSGAGISLGLIVRRFLGLSIEARDVTLDPVIPVALNGLRVRLSLFGKPVTLSYEISGAGHGVSSVIVNGAALPLTNDTNPHRKGAARLDRAQLVARLDRADNTIQLKVG